MAPYPPPSPSLPPHVVGPARPLAAIRRGSERLSLRWRLALGYALMLLLVLAPLAALQASTIHTLLYNDAAATLIAATESAATAARPNPRPGKGAAPTSNPATTPSAVTIARSALARQSLDADAAAVVADASGRALGSSTLTGDAAPDAAGLVDASRVRQLVGGHPDAGRPYHASTARGPYLVALALLPASKPGPKHVRAAPALPDGLPGSASEGQASREVLVLARSLRPIDTTTMYVWTLTLGGTTAALLAATILGALLVRHALRPLTRVAVAAGAIAGGDYARRVAVPPARDEVGRLAVAFNAMAVSVEDAFAAQRRFVADAAHELRTPLTALGGYADVLLLGAASSPSDLAASLEAMRGETRRMTRLVNDLLALARLDGGDPTTCNATTTVDLADVLREACARARLLHPDRHITLDLALSPPVARGDGDRLRQVVANLVDNALKFTEPGGHVRLALRAEADAAVVVVRDDGIGIAPEDLPHVRERFYRADRARGHTTGTGGTGLGLAIVQAIVTMHGGTLEIASAPGRGTKATVRLPPADGRSPQPRTSDTGRPDTGRPA